MGIERNNLDHLASRYPGVVAYVHYRLSDGTPAYNAGVLTTIHPACNHGLPVFLASTDQTLNDLLIPGMPYGPADLPTGYDMTIIASSYLTDRRCLPVAARKAGYNAVDGEGLPQ